MTKWQNERIPPDVSSLKEFGMQLQQSPWKNELFYSKGNLTIKVIETDGSTSLLFFNPVYLAQFENSKQVILDTSLKRSPSINDKDTYVLTIMFPRSGRVSKFAKFDIIWLCNNTEHSILNLYNFFSDLSNVVGRNGGQQNRLFC